jgi:hypothetical protein
MTEYESLLRQRENIKLGYPCCKGLECFRCLLRNFDCRRSNDRYSSLINSYIENRIRLYEEGILPKEKS